MVRLVKGAYWDTEVKRAQERGLADYPVFTRKAMTDLCYTACTRKLLAARAAALSAIRHPQCAHGRERDRGCRRGRGLRVPAPARHGRGALRAAARRIIPRPPAGSMRRSAATAICSPIWCGGCWRTGRTRRSCRSRPILRCRSPTILERPQHWIGDARHARHPKIPLPRDLYAPERRNSSGVEFGDRASLDGAARRDPHAPKRPPRRRR